MEPDVVLHALRSGDVELLAGALHNDLETAAIALRPELGDRLEDMYAAGALRAIVSGSGPTVVALAPDEAAARGSPNGSATSFDRVCVVPSPAGGPGSPTASCSPPDRRLGEVAPAAARCLVAWSPGAVASLRDPTGAPLGGGVIGNTPAFGAVYSGFESPPPSHPGGSGATAQPDAVPPPPIDDRRTVVIDDLLEHRLLAPLSKREQRAVARLCSEATFAPGEMLLHQGQPALGLHLLLDGQVEVVVHVNGEAHEVAVLGPGSVVGELSLLSAGARLRSRRACPDRRPRRRRPRGVRRPAARDRRGGAAAGRHRPGAPLHQPGTAGPAGGGRAGPTACRWSCGRCGRRTGGSWPPTSTATARPPCASGSSTSPSSPSRRSDG